MSAVMYWGYKFDPENPLHWWFGDCPTEELILCWQYEYLRDCPHAVQEMLRWREKNPIESWSGGALKYFRGDPFERIIDEWPLMPWLEIPQEDRVWYLEVHNTLAKWSWHGFEEWWLKQHPPAATFTVSDWDWGKSDTQLDREFREWRKRNRPKTETIRERRGYRSLSQKAEVWLKQLGVWRLWRRAGLSHNQILSHFERHERRPYQHQPEVSKAIWLAACRLEYEDHFYRALSKRSHS